MEYATPNKIVFKFCRRHFGKYKVYTKVALN